MPTHASFDPRGFEGMLEGAEVKRLNDKAFLPFPPSVDLRHKRSQGLPLHWNVVLENMFHN